MGVALRSYPDEMVQSMRIRKTYIAHGEAFAKVFIVYHEEESLKSASVISKMSASMLEVAVPYFSYLN